MDPTAAYKIVLDVTASAADRLEALNALREWSDRGGFPPAGMTWRVVWTTLGDLRLSAPSAFAGL